MSRARPIVWNGEEHWFDTARNGELANDQQLELLATVEQVDLDDLLDAVVTQGEVVKRLRLALGQDPIPTDVLERREAWREERQVQPMCRKCDKEGDSTKHHFVNKWILKELDHYQSRWADRSVNCIPLCIGCHRHIHQRDDEDKSIVSLLSDDEKRFVDAALSALAQERPMLLIRIGRGDRGVYEARLVKDWFNDLFRVEEEPAELSSPRHLRAVC